LNFIQEVFADELRAVKEETDKKIKAIEEETDKRIKANDKKIKALKANSATPK
jgi:hypothetical protein